MKASKILLLVLLLGFGGALETAWDVRNRVEIGASGCRVMGGRWSGPSHSYESEAQAVVAKPTPRVEVRNEFGSVRVLTGPEGEIRVLLRKVVFIAGEADARAFADKIQLATVATSDGLVVSTNRDALSREQPWVGFETHLELSVPAGARAEVRNAHGRVEVTGIQAADVENSYDAVAVRDIPGDARLANRHGDVVVANVKGELRLESKYGEVELSDLASAATVDHQHGDLRAARTAGLRLDVRYGNVSVEQVEGDFELRGEHAGLTGSRFGARVDVETSYREVELREVAGGVAIRSQHGPVSARDVKGSVVAATSYDDVELIEIGGPAEVSVDHGGVRAAGLRQGALIKASGEDVVVDGFKGALEIEVRRGDVHLIPDGILEAAVSANVVNGSVVLEVPAGSRFTLDATAVVGTVEASDVPGLTTTETAERRVAGSVGSGGSEVRLRTDHGDVSLRPRSAVATRKER